MGCEPVGRMASSSSTGPGVGAAGFFPNSLSKKPIASPSPAAERSSSHENRSCRSAHVQRWVQRLTVGSCSPVVYNAPPCLLQQLLIIRVEWLNKDGFQTRH